VNDERELGRWLDEGSDAPDELRRLLGSGRAALGNKDELARLQASLAQALGPAAGLGDGAPMSGTARIGGEAAVGRGAPMSGGGSALKLWLVGGVIATIGGVAVWNMRRAEPIAAPSVVEAAPSASVEAPVAAVSSVAPTPSVEPTVEPPVAASAEPARPAPRAARPAPRAESEAELLARAQAALATDPARALTLTREHRRRFPQGTLSQEREVIAIEALKRAGKARAAGEKASEFEQRYRGSVHEGRVRESVTPESAGSTPRK
jgi:hypothetical protein